eukprot:CAMPEP_0170187806 /NCGR_PEP_ID=MMETSP0040_2-20121228/42636_1 /TAXON_ID=641309 /ORGANISM="Lotharella oceanica, Strain CCMP622" /LENGTH=186 /DNA_ID=CAMNT_0010434925 /DNA_START=174 /DNA_END=734 /DNA_ORIENTATION=+
MEHRTRHEPDRATTPRADEDGRVPATRSLHDDPTDVKISLYPCFLLVAAWQPPCFPSSLPPRIRGRAATVCAGARVAEEDGRVDLPSPSSELSLLNCAARGGVRPEVATLVHWLCGGYGELQIARPAIACDAGPYATLRLLGGTCSCVHVPVCVRDDDDDDDNDDDDGDEEERCDGHARMLITGEW